MRIEGKTALVTGGASGLGQAVVMALLERLGLSVEFAKLVGNCSCL